MWNYRWCSFLLLVSMCSLAIVQCTEINEFQILKIDNVELRVKDNVERSPRPNIDQYEIQMSLSSSWLDTVDVWFKKTIRAGKNALLQLGRTGINVMGHIIDFIPTKEAVFQAAKDVLIALPQEVIVYAIDAYCNVASHVHAIEPFIPDRKKMHIDFVTSGLDKPTIMERPESICDHPKFNKDRETVMVVTGWLSDVNTTNEALIGIYEAYKTRDVNFMFFDTAQYVDTLYIWSAFNTKAVGQFLGESLVSLSKCVDPDKLHLIGHSLGAHISGYAARTLNCLTKKLVSRVTGLDPAHPCFREGEDINGLRRGDAAFVDIIHSNCGVLGRRSPLGDVDFYPNGRHPLQPGCLTIICSHSRSWELYAETVIPGNEHSFMSTRCDSYSSLKAGNCDHSGRKVPMGYAVPRTVKGDYFLETAKEKPYGMSKNYKEESGDKSCA